MVRERYKTTRQESDNADADRRVSFMAYACDPYPNVQQVGERKDEDFKLNHFYDEPSPEMQLQLDYDAQLGSRRPRASSFQNAEIPQRWRSQIQESSSLAANLRGLRLNSTNEGKTRSSSVTGARPDMSTLEKAFKND